MYNSKGGVYFNSTTAHSYGAALYGKAHSHAARCPSELGGRRLDAVGDGADPVDLADDLVAVLEPQRRLAEAADAARRAGEDQVARLERHLS